MDNWIEPKEGLPNEHDQVLIIVDGNVQPLVFEYEPSNSEGEFTFDYLIDYRVNQVTAWMPLPTTPERFKS